MTADPPAAEPAAPAARPSARESGREVIYRHRLPVRLTHWINALAIVVLIGTGLNIFNAHPALYWGKKGNNLDAASRIVWIGTEPTPAGPRGVVRVGALRLDTTGVLGRSKQGGAWAARAWPAWSTIPGPVNLADGRRWHFFFAWVLALNGLAYLLWSVFSRHVQRDLWPTLADLKAIPRSILDHLKNRHPTGEAAKRYNVLQRFAYLGLILAVAGMVFTGLSMSPGFNAVAPWTLDLLGGRQSARTLHFLCFGLIFVFIVVHLVEVILAGPINEVRSIITGRYAVPPDHDA